MTHPHITVVGNLTSDPDMKYVGSGTAVASFTVASTPRTYNRNTSEWEDGEPMFIRCSVWRDYAENATESLTKGMRVIVHGRLQVRSYQRQDGSQGTSIEMQVDEVGPSLRYATAQVTKSAPNSSPRAPHAASNQNYGQGYQQRNVGAQNDAQGGMANGGHVTGGGYPVWGAQNGAHAPNTGRHDQWTAPQEPAFDENPPF